MTLSRPISCVQHSPQKPGISKQSSCCTTLRTVSRAIHKGMCILDIPRTIYRKQQSMESRCRLLKPKAWTREISMPQNCGTRGRPPGLKERLVNQCAVEIQASHTINERLFASHQNCSVIKSRYFIRPFKKRFNTSHDTLPL